MKRVTRREPGARWRDYIEAPALLGYSGRLAGIFCRGLSGHQPRKAIIFINAGAIYHVGWARMHVEMARELARSGIASLRFDLAGIGDSEASPQGAPHLYSALSDDVRAAIDWLQARGIRDLTVFGTCSGAYQAFHAAISDRRITRIALVNQLCFIWGPAYAVQLEAWRRTKATELAARSDAQDLAIGALSVRGVSARMLLRTKQLAKFALRHATNLFVRGNMAWTRKNLVERWFEDLSSRGTRVLLVYGENDPGLDELERYMGPQGQRATALPGVTKHLIATHGPYVHAERSAPAAARDAASLCDGTSAGICARGRVDSPNRAVYGPFGAIEQIGFDAMASTISRGPLAWRPLDLHQRCYFCQRGELRLALSAACEQRTPALRQDAPPSNCFAGIPARPAGRG